MKKTLMLLGVIVAVMGFSTEASAKKMMLINLDKGEMPTDVVGVEASLSEEHATTKGGLSLQLEVKAKAEGATSEGWYVGEYGSVKRGVWDGYEYLRFDVFNPTKEMLPLNITIRQGSLKLDSPIVARPGQSTLELQIAGLTDNKGAAFDLTTKLKAWNINQYGAVKAKSVLFISNIRLETDGDEAAPKKEAPKAKGKK